MKCQVNIEAANEIKEGLAQLTVVEPKKNLCLSFSFCCEKRVRFSESSCLRVAATLLDQSVLGRHS